VTAGWFIVDGSLFWLACYCWWLVGLLMVAAGWLVVGNEGIGLFLASLLLVACC